jgi:hypothetical protein
MVINNNLINQQIINHQAQERKKERRKEGMMEGQGRYFTMIPHHLQQQQQVVMVDGGRRKRQKMNAGHHIDSDEDDNGSISSSSLFSHQEWTSRDKNKRSDEYHRNHQSGSGSSKISNHIEASNDETLMRNYGNKSRSSTVESVKADELGTKQGNEVSDDVKELRMWIKRINVDVDDLLNTIKEKNQALSSAPSTWQNLSATEKEEFYDGKISQFKFCLLDDLVRCERCVNNLRLERTERQKQLAELQIEMQKHGNTSSEFDSVSRTEYLGELARLGAKLSKTAKLEDIERLERRLGSEQNQRGESGVYIPQGSEQDPSRKRRLTTDFSKDTEDLNNDERHSFGGRNPGLARYLQQHPPMSSSTYSPTMKQVPEYQHIRQTGTSSASLESINYKYKLQELLAKEHLAPPSYHQQDSSLPHTMGFVCEVRMGNLTLAHGQGPTKKEAEQESARVALEKIERNGLLLKL